MFKSTSGCSNNQGAIGGVTITDASLFDSVPVSLISDFIFHANHLPGLFTVSQLSLSTSLPG